MVCLLHEYHESDQLIENNKTETVCVTGMDWDSYTRVGIYEEIILLAWGTSAKRRQRISHELWDEMPHRLRVFINLTSPGGPKWCTLQEFPRVSCVMRR